MADEQAKPAGWRRAPAKKWRHLSRIGAALRGEAATPAVDRSKPRGRRRATSS